MKVALIMQHIDTSRGGAETSLVQYATHLARGGCQVHIYTTSPVKLSGGVVVHTVACRCPLRAARTLSFTRRVAKCLRHKHFDIVHALTPTPGADIYQPRGGIARQTVRRNIAARSGWTGRVLKRLAIAGNLNRRLTLRLEDQICRSPDRPVIAAVSDYVARQIRDEYGLGPPRVRVIFNGVDVQRADPQQAAEQRRRIRQRLGLAPETVAALFVAHNFRLKGLQSAIRALVGVRHRATSPAKLVVVGRDNPRPYRRLARRLGVADHVLFAGSIQSIANMYHAADLVVHPTFHDACSRVVLEALVCGLPVVTTRDNGAAEVIRDGQEGYVVDSGHDVAGLIDVWCSLMDPEARLRCSREAVKRRRELSMERHVAEMLELYRQVGRGEGGEQ